MEPRIRVPGPPRWFAVSGRLCGTRLGLPGSGAAAARRQSCGSGVHARWRRRERDGGRESNACFRPVAGSCNDALRIQNRASLRQHRTGRGIRFGESFQFKRCARAGSPVPARIHGAF
ncbi:hypothetical protein C2845_PM16G22320 [Panicum miliaceum]|uniref:Uncharacterized protein n=1 Tax=Panicum miliaceum TaxID=4540 RepID=A0A3L6PV05_PANMI|nr:hypothetical protein C2845_PM16G22320 [Panicum miliaceum]